MWLGEETCSICSRPVEKSGSLYCSSDCKRQDELSASMSLGLVGTHTHVSSGSSASTFDHGSKIASMDTLRYTALSSPTLAATRSPVKHAKRPSYGAPPMSPLALAVQPHSRLNSADYLSGRVAGHKAANRWGSSVGPSRGRAGEAQSSRRSSSSSRSSESEEEAESSDPTTPSPHIWATSAPHAKVGEPSALMLPPAMQADAVKILLKSPKSIGLTFRQPEAPGYMHFTRRPSRTNVPAPVLFSSPVLTATAKSNSQGKLTGSKSPANALGRVSVKASPLATPMGAGQSSGSDTSDLDLRDGESSPSSSGFSLEQSSSLLPSRPSPLTLSARLPDREQPFTGQATSMVSSESAAGLIANVALNESERPVPTHGRMSSDSALTRAPSRDRTMTNHEFRALPFALSPKSSRDPTPGPVSPVKSASTTVEQLEEVRAAASDLAASVSRSPSTTIGDAEAQSHGGRGRSNARGTRSSSRRRSPSPPRRGDRRVASHGRCSSATVPVSPIPVNRRASDGIESADYDLSTSLGHDALQEEDEGPRGRQGKRSSGLLACRAGGFDTICEQAFSGYGH